MMEGRIYRCGHVLTYTIAVLFLMAVPVSAVPTAGFTGTPTSGVAPLTVQFTDTSAGGPTGWTYYFGDESWTGAWTLMNSSSSWLRRSSLTMGALPDGSLIVSGGYASGTYFNDTWRSVDKGGHWILMNSSSGWVARTSAMAVLPDGSLVVAGGENTDGTVSMNDTWRSTDNGATWALMNASSGWQVRYGHQLAALPDGSLVLAGGMADGGVRLFNDTWRSVDKGGSWILMNSSSGWISRSDPSIAALSDNSLILAGGTTGIVRLGDVWRSSNKGATWILMNSSSSWLGRSSSTMGALPDGSLILAGGIGGGTTLEDTWRSTDLGKTWHLLNSTSGWVSRSDAQMAVLPDGSVVISGGMSLSGPLNDTWRMTTAGSNLRNPIHTYQGGTYTVALQAYDLTGANISTISGYITASLQPYQPTPVPPANDPGTPPGAAAPPGATVATALASVAGKEVTFTFGQGVTALNPVAVDSVVITPSRDIGTVQVNANPVNLGPVLPGQIVAGTISIEPVGIPESAIAKGKIRFTVSREWLTDHGLSPGDMALSRNHDGVWAEIPTTFESESGGVCHYTATTPGFSYFVVTVRKNAVTVTATPSEAIAGAATVSPEATIPATPAATIPAATKTSAKIAPKTTAAPVTPPTPKSPFPAALAIAAIAGAFCLPGIAAVARRR